MRAPKQSPTPKNIERHPRPDASATRQHRPGDNSPAKGGASRPETPSVRAEGEAKRAEHHREEGKSRANLNAELARQTREEGASGQTGRDAASAHGGVGDYLSSD
jgi:hypothetical protein